MIKENNALTKKVFRGGLILIFFSVLTSPLGYFVRMIFSRSLSITDYGLIYAVLSFFGIFTIVNDLGFGYATTYFIPKYFNEKKFNLCWLLYKYDQVIEILTSILFSIIFILSSDILATHFFKHQGAKELIYLFSFYLLANGIVSSIQHFFVGLQKSVYYSTIEFVRLSFTLLFSFLFFIFDISSVRYFAFAFITSYFIVILIYSFLIRSKFSYLKTKLVWKPTLFNEALKYAMPTFLTASLYIFIGHLDVLFLTYYQSIELVGVYNIIFPIVSVSILMLQPIQRMILPLVSELSEKQNEKLGILMKQLLKLVPFISVYFGLFIFMFSKGLISMMFGYKWVAQANIALKIMALFYTVSLLNIYLTSVLAGLGKVKPRLKIAIVLLILGVISGFIGAKYFGIIGIIFANTFVFTVSIILTHKEIRKSIFVKIPYSFYAKLIVLALIIAGFRSLFSYDPISIPHVMFWGISYTILMSFIALKAKIVDYRLLTSLVGDKLRSNRFLVKMDRILIRILDI